MRAQGTAAVPRPAALTRCFRHRGGGAASALHQWLVTAYRMARRSHFFISRARGANCDRDGRLVAAIFGLEEPPRRAPGPFLATRRGPWHGSLRSGRVDCFPSVLHDTSCALFRRHVSPIARDERAVRRVVDGVEAQSRLVEEARARPVAPLRRRGPGGRHRPDTRWVWTTVV